MVLVTPRLKKIFAQAKKEEERDTRAVGLTLSEIQRIATREEFAERAKTAENRIRIVAED
jgi:hypothetical protein